MTAKTEAQKAYSQTRPTEAQIKMLGEGSLTPVQRATVDEIETHIQNCSDAAAEYKVNLDYRKVEFGKTREEIFEIAASKAKALRRSAGARALSAKYGKSIAEQIIARKTGKHVSLKY